MRYKIKYKYKMGLPKKNVFFFFHSRKNPLSLIVALNDSQLAEGQLYWDDGVRIGKYKNAHLHKKNPPNSSLTRCKYCFSLFPWIVNINNGFSFWGYCATIAQQGCVQRDGAEKKYRKMIKMIACKTIKMVK